jgi:magnesium chelatase family protein
VTAARDRQAARFEDTPWRLNADVPGPRLADRWPLTDAAQQRLEERVATGRLTRRGATRVHRIAWTVADLRDLERPGVDELDVALRLRTGDPLMVASLGLVANG